MRGGGSGIPGSNSDCLTFKLNCQLTGGIFEWPERVAALHKRGEMLSKFEGER